MDPLFQHWHNRIRETLKPLLPPGTPCALTCFPNHWNPGDSAIWCGTRKILAELQIPVRYVCSFQSYRREDLKAALPEGPILILGGGNLGDVYPDETGLRRRIFEDFPDRHILQLPQSIWFQSPGNIPSFSRMIGRLKQFTLLTRDTASEALARRHFDCRTILCPDLSLTLDSTDFHLSPPAMDIFGLLRLDQESPASTLQCLPDIGFPHEDWQIPGTEVNRWQPSARAFLRFDGWINRLYPRHAPIARRLCRWSTPAYERLACLRTQRGIDLVNRGRVLVTNRLHGHLLGLLSGRPQVILDTVNGKIRSYYDTWTQAHPQVHWANNLSEAREIAVSLLD
jgi:pyruvyl transferase EpsO